MLRLILSHKLVKCQKSLFTILYTMHFLLWTLHTWLHLIATIKDYSAHQFWCTQLSSIFYCNTRHNILLHCTAQHCIILHCTVFHGSALHKLSLYQYALYCTPLLCMALHSVALHCTALHFTELQCTELHCTELHYTSLHFTDMYCFVLQTLPRVEPI